MLDRVTPGAAPGPYLLQACIVGLHAQAEDTATTDWAEIHALYTVLEHQAKRRNPTVSFNRIVAMAMTEGVAPALIALEDLAQGHSGLPRLESVRAHLLERAVCADDAVSAYREAIASTVNVAAQGYLRVRLRRLLAGGQATGTPGQ